MLLPTCPLLLRRLALAAFLASLPAALPAAPAPPVRFHGDGTLLGGGEVESWLELDSQAGSVHMAAETPAEDRPVARENDSVVSTGPAWPASFVAFGFASAWNAVPAVGPQRAVPVRAIVGPQPQIIATGTYTSVADTTTVATGQTTAFAGFATPAISGGNVAFLAAYNPNDDLGIFTGVAGTRGGATVADLTTVATGQTTAFNSFVGTPLISGGNVAFLARYNGGQGIFTGVAGTRGATTIADYTTVPTGQTTAFASFGNPAISGANLVVLAYCNGGATPGIFTGVAGTKGAATVADYSTVATGQTTVFSNFQSPVISGGNVAFRANYNADAGQGIFTGVAGTRGATTIADYTTVPTGQTTAFSSFGNPAISGGNVAFLAGYNAGAGQGIFTGVAGSKGAATVADLTTVATGQTTAFTVFGAPVLSGGNVAFRALYNGGAGVGIFLGTAGTQGALTLADYATTAPGRGFFTNFSTTIAIGGGNVAFTGNSYVSGSSGATGNGLYLYSNGSLFNVAAVGDALFGSTISRLALSSSGLDGNTLTYYYTLASGVSGVATLSTVPEPATWAGGALLLAGAGWTLRRRLRTVCSV